MSLPAGVKVLRLLVFLSKSIGHLLFTLNLIGRLFHQ